MVNKKAQSMGLAIISAIGIIIVGLTFVNFLMPEVTTFRIAMNCSDAANIHDGNKLLCLVGDITIPYWIYLVLGIAIAAITARVVFG